MKMIFITKLPTQKSMQSLRGGQHGHAFSNGLLRDGIAQASQSTHVKTTLGGPFNDFLYTGDNQHG